MICFKLKVILVCLCVSFLETHGEADCPKIITRSDWNASAPKEQKPLKINPPPFVVIHHSATASCSTEEQCKKLVKSIQNYHMIDQDWEDIGYNFLIGGDGLVYEGRGWGIHGAHVIKFNARSIGICLLGNFVITPPTENQLESMYKLISCGVETNNLPRNYRLIGHTQGSNTLCPGRYLFRLIEKSANFDPDPK